MRRPRVQRETTDFHGALRLRNCDAEVPSGFGPRLSYYRRRAKVSLDTAGFAVGYSRSWVSGIETDREAPPRREVMWEFAVLYRLSGPEFADLLDLAYREQNGKLRQVRDYGEPSMAEVIELNLKAVLPPARLMSEGLGMTREDVASLVRSAMVHGKPDRVHALARQCLLDDGVIDALRLELYSLGPRQLATARETMRLVYRDCLSASDDALQASQAAFLTSAFPVCHAPIEDLWAVYERDSRPQVLVACAVALARHGDDRPLEYETSEGSDLTAIYQHALRYFGDDPYGTAARLGVPCPGVQTVPKLLRQVEDPVGRSRRLFGLRLLEQHLAVAGRGENDLRREIAARLKTVSNAVDGAMQRAVDRVLAPAR